MIGAELAARNFTLFIPDLFDTQVALMQAHATFAGRTTLEVGARDGRHSEAALALGAREATAIEYRPGASAVIQRREDRPVRFVYGDCRTVDPDGPFDIVMAYGIVYHVPDPGALIGRLIGWARERVFISTHCAPHAAASRGGYCGDLRSEGDAVIDAATTEPSLWLTRSELRRAITDYGGTIMQEHDYMVGPVPGVWMAVRVGGVG